ncbi:hypothetical protein ACLOJK_017733 [Asimina triloba]
MEVELMTAWHDETASAVNEQCPRHAGRIFRWPQGRGSGKGSLLINLRESTLPQLAPKALKAFLSTPSASLALSCKEFAYVEHLIEGIHEEKHIYEYSSIEGGYIGSKLKTCSYKFQFLPAPDGGTLVRMDSEYESLTGEPFPDEDAMNIKELILKVPRVAGAYLLTDPDAYV